ncbi:MAG: hypothetical protein Q4A70_04285 [Candidatus Saccharibacteria bacterium]|nr:hypothetical protein [Candidatus Saccharibacteria bacterium]
MGETYWEVFEMELKSLDENAQIMDVPLEKQPAKESLEKSGKILDFKIKKNLQNQVLSLEAAKNNVVV